MTPTPQFLVDADIVAFKAASAVESYDVSMWTLHGYEQDAHDYCETYFESIKQTLGSGRLVLYLSDKDNWRKDILPTYKANRTGSRKPMLLPAIRQWMIDKYKAVSIPSLEADDLLGIKATKEPFCIIISEDKDLKTIPAMVFNPAKDKQVTNISQWEADYNHMLQTLTGDQADGYAGCPSIGPKTAQKILADCETKREMWNAVLAAYAKQKLSPEVALAQAQVARICRAEDFNFKTRKVRPWTPPV